MDKVDKALLMLEEIHLGNKEQKVIKNIKDGFIVLNVVIEEIKSSHNNKNVGGEDGN